jgi:hypothetical protein
MFERGGGSRLSGSFAPLRMTAGTGNSKDKGEDKSEGEGEDKSEGEGEDKSEGKGEDKSEGEGEGKSGDESAVSLVLCWGCVWV